MTDVTFRVRPFQQTIDRGADVPALQIGGRIEGGQFIIDVCGQRVDLRTATVDRDSRGEYAIVIENEYVLPDGFRLVGQVEHEEDSPPGGQIMLYLTRGSYRSRPTDCAVHENCQPL